MADSNIKLMARVPIVPDDFINKDQHKVHELVMDFENADIYVKKDDTSYINITGQIKEEIKEIQDGSTIMHIVTEDTLPPVSDRKENNWYYVVLNSDAEDDPVETVKYIYYGLCSQYSPDKNYLLIGMNMIYDTDTVQITVQKGYDATFYVPRSIDVAFTDVTTTAQSISFTSSDYVYAVNSTDGSVIAYEVYTLQLSEGTHLVRVDVNEGNYYTITFDSNVSNMEITYPAEYLRVTEGSAIGKIDDPEWDEPRYIFKGWSLSKTDFINVVSTYVPTSNMTIYAYFEYNGDTSLATYYASYETDED